MNTLTSQKMIHHCFSASIDGRGGIETYVSSLVRSGISGVSDRPINSLKNLCQSQFQLLHIHDPDIFRDLRAECPAIITLHNHSSYCPSGTKYLADRELQCDRIMNPLGCTWGHLVDGCGSRRPQKILKKWHHTYHFLEALKKLRIPIIANSNYVRNQIINSGVSPDRVITLRCAVRSPQSQPQPLTSEIHQDQQILFVGRIVPDKGVKWLIKALAQTEPRIHLHIAGDGWEQPDMQKLATDMGLNDRITWHGWCNYDKLSTLYHQSLAVVFPSVWPEPAGLVSLEAYAHYRPVIASAVGGIPEHVQDNVTGILVTPHHISQLAAAINHLASNYHQTRQMGEQGQAWYQQEFTIDVHARHLEKIYAQTINDFWDDIKRNEDTSVRS